MPDATTTPATTTIEQSPPLLVKKLSGKAKTPTRGSQFAAGYDVYRCVYFSLVVLLGLDALCGGGLDGEKRDGGGRPDGMRWGGRFGVGSWADENITRKMCARFLG